MVVGDATDAFGAFRISGANVAQGKSRPNLGLLPASCGPSCDGLQLTLGRLLSPHLQPSNLIQACASDLTSC